MNLAQIPKRLAIHNLYHIIKPIKLQELQQVTNHILDHLALMLLFTKKKTL